MQALIQSAKAVIDYDPSLVTVNTITQTIRNTGYDVIEVPPVESKPLRVDRERTLKNVRSMDIVISSYSQLFLEFLY